jgi:polyhydroxyalkanoate synthesis regulator phasin
MRKRTKLAASAGAAIAVAGAGGAIAATQLSPNEESRAVLDDAAKQLGVDPAKLSDALKQALENRIDRAVEDGTLTKEQADAMKERVEADDFPLFAGPLLGHPHRGGFGFRMHGFRDLDAAAAFLGVTEAQLRESLEGGKTLAEVAKAKGKSVDALVSAIVAAATKRLDEAVEEGRMTKAQRDEIVDGLKAWTTDLVNGVRPAFPGRDGKPGFRFRGPGFHFDEEREAPPRPAA